MKLFGSGKSGANRIGVFGKLPTYGDFMSQHADSPGAQSLAKWLQEGVGHGATAQTQEQFLHFIWEPKKSRGNALVGCLWPSADSAGRRFPFALFASVPSDALFAHGGRRVIAAEPIWRQMHDLHAHLLTIGDLGAQYAMLGETTPAAPLDLAASEQTYAERARTSSLQGAQRVAVALHLRDLVAFADTLRNAGTDLAYATRMRVHGHVDPDIEASTWLQILAAQLGNRDPSGALFVRVSAGDGHRSVTLFHRPMTASDLGYLLAPADAYRMADAVGYRTITSSPQDTKFREVFDRRWGSRPSVYRTLLELGLESWTPADLAAPAPASAAPPTADVITSNLSTGPVTAEPDDSDDVITGEVVLDSGEEMDGDVTGPVDVSGAVLPVAPPPAEPPTGEAGAEPPPSEDTPGEPAPEPVEGDAEAPAAEPESDAGAEPEQQPEQEADAGPAPEPAEPEPVAEEPSAAESPEPEPETGATPDAVPAGDAEPRQDGHDALVARIRELARGTLRAGRVIRIRADEGDGELGGPDLMIYADDGSSSGRSVTSDSPLAAEVAAHSEARRLLDDLAERHRTLEAELEASISAACARSDAESAE